MKKILSLGLLMTVMSGTTALADRDFTYYGDDYRYDDIDYRFGDRSMGQRYRNRYKDPKLCLELRDEVVAAREIFESSYDRKRDAQYSMNQANGELQSRKAALSRAENRVMSANGRLQNLKSTQARFDELMAQYQSELSKAQAEKAGADAQLSAAKERKEKDCNGWGRLRAPCRDAHDALDKAESRMRSANNQLGNATANVERLNRLPSDLDAAEKEVRAANQGLNQEQSKLPTIASLQANADAVNANYADIASQFNSDEDNYGRKAVRFEQCRKMEFESKKGKSYKTALIRLSKNNGENCQRIANRLLSSTRGFAARQGIKEAYEDYCVSERLVRKVYVDRDPAQP